MKNKKRPEILSPGEMRQKQIQPKGGKTPWVGLQIFSPAAIRRALNVPWPKQK